MKKLRHFALILAVILIPFISFAQPERILNQWNPNGEVKDLFLSPDGESIYLVGDFEYWTNYKPYATVLDRGTLLPVSGQDFRNGIVNDMIADGLGGWYVGGAFDINENGGEADQGLFHLDADLNIIPGSIDANGQVNDLKLRGDTLIIAGKFTSVGGVARRGLAAISITTDEVLDLNVPINGSVSTVDIWNDILFLGGSFDAVNDFGNYGAQLDKFTGNVDAYFDCPNGTVNVSVADGNGGWFIGGDFSLVGDSVRRDLAHLGSDGRVSGWKSNLGVDFDQTSYVKVLEIHGDYLYVGGTFEKIGGVLRNNTARVNIETGEVNTWDPNFYVSPECFAFHDQTAFVGGTHALELAGNWVTHGGVVDPVTANVAPLSKNIDEYVRHSVPDGNGGFFIAGRFHNIGDSSRLGLAQIDTNGSVTAFDRHFDELYPYSIGAMTFHDGILYYSTGGDTEPLTAVDLQGNKVPITFPEMPQMKINLLKTVGDTLFLGGVFKDSNGNYQHSVRAINLTENQLLPLEPLIDGVVSDVEYKDGNLYLAGAFGSVNYARYGAVINDATLLNNNIGSLTNRSIHTSAGDGQGGFYFSGLFDIVLEDSCSGVVYLDEMGIPTCLGINTDGEIITMLARGDILFIGGDFSEINGIARSKFAAWSISNSALLDWNPTFDLPVRDFTMYGDTLFLAGSFTEVDGQPRTRLAGFDLGTHTLIDFAPSINGDVYAIHVRQDELFVGGAFTQINSVSGRLRSFNLLTSEMTDWNPNPSDWVYDITSNDDQIFVGGKFVFIGGVNNHAKFAAFDYQSGMLSDIAFPLNTSIEVTDICTNGTKILIGGHFAYPNGSNYIAFNLETNEIINVGRASSTVRCIAHSGNNFFVGGDFAKIGGVVSSGLTGLDMTTNIFNGFSPRFSGTVTEVESDGNFLYAGGLPSTVEGTPTGKLAIFDISTGEVVNSDEYFGITQYNQTEIVSLHKHGNRLYVGLKSTNPLNSYEPILNFAFCINTLDNSLIDFDPHAYGNVYTISATDDAVYIGGDLIHLGGDEIDGFAVYDIASGAFLPDQLTLLHGNIYTMAVHDDLLYAGGSGISLGGAPQKPLVAYNFQTQQEEPFTGGGPSGVVYALELYDDVLYFGGKGMGENYQFVSAYDLSAHSFQNLNLPLSLDGGRVIDLAADASGLYVAHTTNGLPNTTRYVSAYDPSTGLRIDDWGINVTSLSAQQINTISLQGDHLYIGGNTKLIGNKRRTNLASIDLANGMDTPWKPSANNTVNIVLALDSGLFVGGAFTSINSYSGAKYIARLNKATGTLKPSNYNVWIKNEVYDLAFNPNDQHIYVSGNFTTGDGSDANYLLALSQETNIIASAWESGPLHNPAYLTFYNDSLWIQEEDVNSNCASCYVRKLEPSGAFSDDSIPIFGQGVRSMAFQDDRIMLGGNFQGAGGIRRHNILEIDAATGELTDFNPDIPLDPIQKVGLVGDNLILMGKTGNKYTLMAIDVNTYEVLPAFAEANPFTDFNERDMEFYNGEYFYKLQSGGMKRKDGLTGASLPIPEIYNFDLELEGSAGFLYSKGIQNNPEFGGQEGYFARFDIQNDQLILFVPSFDATVQSMAERDGKLFMAGNFTEVNGTLHKGLARFDGATGTLDDWSAGDLPPVDYAKILSTDQSLYYSYQLLDSNTYFMRRVDPLTGALSAWNLPIEATDAVEVAGRLYVAGNAFPVQWINSGDPFAAFELGSCNTQTACSATTIYLDANGIASLTPAEVDGGTTSECTIQSLVLSQTHFTCDDLGENQVYLTATTDDDNSASCSALVTVADTISPQATVQNMSYPIPEAGLLEINPTDFVVDMSDNCGVTSVNIVGEITYTCADQGQTFDIQIAVTDNAGNATVLPATVSINASPECCEAAASLTANTISVCGSQEIPMPIQLVGAPPFQVTVENNGDTLTYTISDPAADSIYVTPLVTATYHLLSVSDNTCFAFAAGTYQVNIDPVSNAGVDQEFNLCADGEALSFSDFIDPEASADAAFSGMSGGLATTDLSGTYTLIDVGQQCANDTAFYQFTFTDPGTVADLTVSCGQPNPTVYQVSFSMEGGTPPFSVNGGTFLGNAFTSSPVSVLATPEFVFAVSDSHGCVVEATATVDDTDGDGVCDAGEIVGCMDPAGSNYNPLATDPSRCFYEAGAAITTIWTGEGDGIYGRIGSGDHSDATLQEWGIAIYPNPGSPDKPIRIAFKDIPERAVFQIEVRDITGSIIQTQELAVPKGNMETELPLKETLSEGVYLVSFVSYDTRITERLVILE